MSNVVVYLPKYESYFYFATWASGITYSTYKLSLTSAYFIDHDDVYGDFAPGWSWIGRKEDVSDEEWRIWIPMMIELIPWILFHHVVSQIIKATSSGMSLCCWYIFTSASFLCYYLGALGMICVMAQTSILYLLTYKRSKSFIWFVHTLLLFAMHILKTPAGFFQVSLGLTDKEHYVLTLALCWIQLRSISYSIDSMDDNLKIQSKDKSYLLQSFLWKLAYCLYLPTLSLGPLILYHEFMQSVNAQFKIWNMKRLIRFILNLIRYIFWIYVIKFFLHLIYFNAIQYHPEVKFLYYDKALYYNKEHMFFFSSYLIQIVQVLNPWALYGLGYCMGQFFLTKYVVVYGLNRSICEMDDIQAPPQPKCIARIHLYSDMWKYFDRGLYKFLVRYIYTPTLESNFSKFFGSLLCFGFVFVWHGMQTTIFIWAFLNFIGITIESIAKSIAKTKQYFELQKKYLTSRNARRFNCLLASPLLAMSAVSNFYFFAGKEIGDIYIQRITHDSWITLLVMHFFLYCCCQVSVDIKNWETHSSIK